MKKFAIVVFMALVAGGLAFGVEGTGSSLTVNATMAPVLTATFGGSNGTISFEDLSGTGTKTSSAATLTITSNYPHWTVSFASQSSTKGNLISSPATVSIPYSLKAELKTTGWGNSSAVTNGLSAYQLMSTDRTIGLTSGNGKTLVGGVDYEITAQLTMPGTGTEMLETGTTFTDTVLVTIASN